MTTLAPVERFRAVLARHLGLGFEETRFGELTGVLERLGNGHDGGPEGYLDRLERVSVNPADLQALAHLLTVGETYFLRNAPQLRAFAESALPARIAARADVRCLRLLSAGCSTGEEAYSLAILVRDRALSPDWSVSILGIDIHAAALDLAARAQYSAWSLRETPENVRRRCFRPVGREFALDPSIRNAVRFEQRNLTEDAADLWLPASFDVIFCRNVLMYFTPEKAREVVGRFTRALAPGGYLFLGHAETLRGLSHDFHLRHTHEAFYYERKDAEGPEMVSDVAAAVAPAMDVAAAVAPEVDRPPVEPPESGVANARPGPDVHRAMELLESERFADALEWLDGQPGHTHVDPDTLLLRAVLLTHSGQLDAAEKVCAALRGLDELSAGAHYLLALCREGAGDRNGAVENDQVATYLDPTFAMPRLHLGLLARKSGDVRGAARELEQALVLLDREDVSRVLLFGGGFTREALRGLCRAELRAAQRERGER